MMNDGGKSDRSIVPEKLPNKADNDAAEVAEERDRAKGNPAKRDKPWTLSQAGLPSALERVGQAARQDRKLRFTALLHHIYDGDRLRRAYMAIAHDAAAGIDGETWKHYGEKLPRATAKWLYELLWARAVRFCCVRSSLRVSFFRC